MESYICGHLALHVFHPNSIPYPSYMELVVKQCHYQQLYDFFISQSYRSSKPLENDNKYLTTISSNFENLTWLKFNSVLKVIILYTSKTDITALSTILYSCSMLSMNALNPSFFISFYFTQMAAKEGLIPKNYFTSISSLFYCHRTPNKQTGKLISKFSRYHCIISELPYSTLINHNNACFQNNVDYNVTLMIATCSSSISNPNTDSLKIHFHLFFVGV